MNTKTAFEIAGGSAPGRAHVAAGRNNQDAFCWAAEEEGLVAVVCDGCGSGPHSEVGAQIGARLLVRAARRLLRSGVDGCTLLERARQDVLASLGHLAREISVDETAPRSGAVTTTFSRTVADHFLFTIVGVLITARDVTTFSLGDGLVVINDESTQLGPFPSNEPPYLGYALLPRAEERGASEGLSFKIHRSMATSDLQSLVLGTDGAAELAALVERSTLRQFWNDDRVFKNADMVRRRLAVLNRGPRPVLLADDTTLVVIRRKAEG